ncbi:MAG: response regulator [Methyloceanibacter sp.]
MAVKRILVVEDEVLIALDITGALEQGGFVVVGPLASVRDALQLLERESVDGALLDANLGGETVGRVADALFLRKVPFAFVSGYGREQLPPQHKRAPLISKPFTGADLLAVVAGF